MLVLRAILLLGLGAPAVRSGEPAPGEVPVEIAYDDGTAERTVVWNQRGNGVAVRFTAGPGSSLLGARFFIGFAPFQNPLGICVLDANGPGGAPGDTLHGFFEEPLDSYSGFQDVAFRAPILLANPDFYVVYLQTRSGSGDSNSFGIDTSSVPDGRSWRFENGAWSHMSSDSGDVMIRAIIAVRTPTAPVPWTQVKVRYQ
jgi:bacillopeptidase F